MRYFLKKGYKKELILLSVVYLFSQGSLLFISGRWWDDWCLYNESFDALCQFGMELGRPSIIPIYLFTKLLPEPGYRWLTFIMFYMNMLFLYKILNNWLRLNSRDCFWICAIYGVVPTNDARILLSIFPYTVGLFFFMAGLSLFTDILHMEKVSVWKRVLSYFLFIIGFVLNSTLFFYVIVFIMIVMNIIHYRKVKRLVAFLDYLILPIAFYSVKTLFFTPYGEYEGYNEVSLNNLIKALTLIPRADWNVLHSTYINIKNTGIMVYAIGMSIILIGIIHHKNLFTVIRQKSKDNNILSKVTVYTNRFESFKTLVLGIIILSCGLFPYIVVRQKNMINTTGWVGRDSILVAWGVAMTVYAICSIVFRKPFSEVILIYLLICSCAFFGKYYLSYQQDYYRQIGFQYQLSLHEDELENMKNIVYMNSDKSLINCQHFYQLNGNAEEVFGDQTRFFIPGLDGLKYLSKEAQDSLNRFVTSGNYHMNDYDVNYKKIDAVIDYSCSISLA